MKKFWLLAIAWIAIILSWCNDEEVCTWDVCTLDNETPVEETQVAETPFFGNRENSAKWAVAMQKPSIDEMENYDAILNWYTQEWQKDYTLTSEDLRILNQCLWQDWAKDMKGFNIYGWYWKGHSNYSNYFSKDELKEWNTLTLTWTYKFDDSKLTLTDDEKAVLSDKWWVIVPADRIEDLPITTYEQQYAEENVRGYYDNPEEWIKVYNKIAWDNSEFERNPASSVLITNDLLLHSFHKLFDNTLKYYEKTISRDTVKDLSQNLFEKFANLAKSESDTDLKETYEFLAAYWAVPAAILVDKDKLSTEWYFDEEKWEWNDWNINDDKEIRNIIRENAKQYISKLDSADKELVSNVLEDIFSANKTVVDTFLSSYSPDFVAINGIMQDYTQFAPRSHYTDNAELKTYFMAMKWLMREKFYFGDDKLTNAALVMVNNISDEDTARLWELSAKIKKLIGWDDDLTLESLTAWMKENEINNIDAIKNLSEEKKSELFKLVPQKIQSTAYSTESPMEIDWEEAKDMTAGFVFFGEKFTLDSYIFDLTTAGSAEVEYAYMPNMQTALIVPDILENNSDAAEMVNLWMTARIAKWDVLEEKDFTQYSSYNKVKEAVVEKLKKELWTTTVMDTAYHKWIDMLGYLINEAEENAPYFKLDPVYRLKNLVTYMGSYTELKHDTLLYVKQNYAEMWWGGSADCNIEVDPPLLPVPKWYIEADIDVVNKLIELNNETKSDFSELDDYVLNNFVEFDTFLNHIKSILVQQMNNEVISDEDFEWMRTAFDKLSQITFPLADWVTQKEMRAALIADIFTSEGWNPLYEAVGRPALMLVMIDDANGKRIARGPIFTHYEFYDSDEVVDANGSRLNDIQWQAAYDWLTWSQLKSALSTLSKNLDRRLKTLE